MSEKATLARYRQLLQEQAEIRKRDLDLNVEIQVCLKEMELRSFAATVVKASIGSETQRFLDRYADQLDDADREFLEQSHRSPADVREHTMWSDSKLKRLESAGRVRARRNDAGHRMYETVSVMELLLNVNSEAEQ